MNDPNPDRHENDNDITRYLIQLQETNDELDKQVTDCRQQLSQMQQTLAEAQRVLAQNRQLETERHRLLVTERELAELKSSFVLLASHEFRTPMMTILSSASLISRYNGMTVTDGDNRERHVQRIKSAVGDLTTLLDGFLSISHVDQSGVPIHLRSLDLTPFLQSVLSEAQAVAKPNQRFYYEHLGNVSAFTIDEQMLKNILLNLLSNASKYSTEGTDIQLTSAIGNEGLILTVRDQGIGIPEFDQPNLFINFFRARNAVHIQGAGLGLYVAKRYVDLLGGTITFTSQVGEGTTFRVQLPFLSKPV